MRWDGEESRQTREEEESNGEFELTFW
jgi:hypothetical protein